MPQFRASVLVRRVLFAAAVSAVILVLLNPSDALARQEVEELPSVNVSEAPSIRIENMGMVDGLAQGSIYEINQDSKGYIWFGTQGGLHRYDGQKFEVFKPVPFDTTSITDAWVWGVTESSDGSIWASTSSGVERMDPKTGQFQHFLHDPTDSTSIARGRMFETVEARDGTIWVAGDGGLSRMDPDRQGVFKRYVHDPDDINSLSATGLFFVSEDSEGYIWASSTDGISRLNPETDEFTRFLGTGTGRGWNGWGDPNLALGTLEDPFDDDIMWVGTGFGLVRLNYREGTHETFLPHPSVPEGSSKNSVLNISLDPSNPEVFWIGLNGGGLARFDSRKKEFSLYQNNPGDPNSVASDVAGSVFTDRSGVVWVGYGGVGIGKFNPESVNITQMVYDEARPEGIMPEGVAWGIFEDSRETLWIGTTDWSADNHLTRYDLRTGDLSRYSYDSENLNGILPGTISSIMEDTEGFVWVGSRGLSRCHPLSMVCRQYVPVRGDSTALPPFGTQALFESPNEPGIIWSGAGGLNRLDVKTGIVKQYVNDRLDPTTGPRGVAHIIEDASGMMWLGTFDMGLVSFDRETETFTRYSYDPAILDGIASIHYETVYERPAEPGILWLAGEYGLERFDVSTGKVRHFPESAGIADDRVYGILEDDDGLLWMYTNKGISSFDTDTEKFRNYGLDDGIVALEGMQNGYAKGASGVMYFGNVVGISAFIPSQLSTNSMAPPVSMTELRVNGRHVDPGPESVLKEPLTSTKSITLPFDQNDFSVDFVALHFADPTNNLYSYRLDGSDQDWTEPGFLKTASFTNVGPGTYTLRVRAANPDGVWNEDGASLGVIILPPWYRTSWAYGMFILLFAGLVFAIDRIQRYRLTKQERARAEIQEAQLRVETAEAEAKALQADNERKKNIERLSEIGKEITASLDFETIFGRLYEHINDLTDAPVFGVGVLSEDGGEIEYRLAIENGKRYAPYTRDTKDKNQFPVWCIEHKDAVLINDVEKEYSKYIDKYEYTSTTLEDGSESEQPQSIIYLPLMSKEKTLGVITVQSFEKDAYTENDLNLLQTMAAYAAVALDNSTAYRKLDGTISELKRTQEQLVQQEKMASLGQLTAGVAHEIKNPLNFVNNFADVNAELATELRELVTSNTDAKMVDVQGEIEDLVAGLQLNARQIAKHGRRADDIVRGMMEHTHRGTGERFPVAVNAFVDEYINMAWHSERATNGDTQISVLREFGDGIGNANISPQEMGRVLINLVNNAFDVVRDIENPEISISTRHVGKNIEIIVSDNGPGVPEAIRGKIFEPFFTTKPTGEGTGLGLSLSHDIVTQGHGGAMRVEKSPSGGAAFVISIPTA